MSLSEYEMPEFIGLVETKTSEPAGVIFDVYTHITPLYCIKKYKPFAP